MTYTVARSNVKTIRPGDPHFTITNGLVVTSRASWDISNNCPAEYRSILLQAINAGWIKPVAHVTEEEYMVMQLSN
jgi:hypothetical protein